jgi:subfamily B ATP-binding cassette protein MsbA
LSSPKTGKPSIRNIKALRPYLSLLRGQTLDLSLTATLMLASTAVTLAIPIYAGRFVDAIKGSDGLATLMRSHLGVLVLLLVLQLLGTFFSSVVGARLGLRTVTRLRQRIYSHLLELPALFFSGQKAGDISTRVTGDVGAIQSMLTGGVFTLAKAVLTLLGSLVLMINLNPRLTLAVLLLIPATIILSQVFAGRLQKLSRTMYDDLGRISSHVQETVGGIRSLKVYNAQTYESRRFHTMITDYQKAGLRRAWLSAGFHSGIQMSMWITLLAIVIYGFTLMNTGRTTSGDLVAFLLLAMRVALPMASLTQLFASAQGAIAAADRLDDVLALATERAPGAPSPAPISTPPALTLEGMSFTYPGTERPVLDGLDLDIAQGQLVGIVGPSGGGKTTLAGLLLGLFPPSEGRLLLDGKPYQDHDLSELRSRMAWVAQDPILYDMSLADNIRFGLTEATDEQVRQAARQAEVLEFADKLPDGLETSCGERGNKLSGGQRQRVALARAFLRNPGLLVLDEPTSALDAASEESIRQAMLTLMAGRTAVVIAHRFSLVKDLDLILVMNEGRLVQQGSHPELMAQGGLYRTLFELQQGEPDRHEDERPR